MAISSDGSTIVAGCHDNHVYCLDKTGRLLWRFKTDGWIHSVAISADGKAIVAGSGDKHLYLLDHLGNLSWKFEADTPVECVAITKDASLIAAISEWGYLILMDKSGQLLLQKKPDGSSRIYHLQFRDDGSLLCARMGGIFLVDRNGLNLHPIAWSVGPSSGLGMSGDGRLIAWGSGMNALCFVSGVKSESPGTEDSVWEVEGTRPFGPVEVTNDGSAIVAGSSDWGIYLFDAKGIEQLRISAGGPICDIALDGEGLLLIAGSEDDDVYLIDMIRSVVWAFPADGPVVRVAAAENGSRVAACLEGRKKIQVFDPRELIEGIVVANDLLRNAQRLERSGRLDEANKVYHDLGMDETPTPPLLSSKRNIKTLPITQVPMSQNDAESRLNGLHPAWSHKLKQEVNNICVSGDGTYVLCSSKDNTLVAYDIDGRFLWKYMASYVVNNLMTSTDGSRIGAALGDEKALFLNRHGTMVHKIATWLWPLAIWISTDNDKLMVCSARRTVILDGTGYPIADWEFLDQGAMVFISDDGNLIIHYELRWSTISAYLNDGTQIWKWRPKPKSLLTDMAMSLNGEVIALTFRNNKLFILDKRGKLVSEKKVGNGLGSVAVSKDGANIVGGGKKKDIIAFSPTGTFQWKLKTTNPIHIVEISTDGQFILAGSTDGSVYLLDNKGQIHCQHQLGTIPKSLSISEDNSMFVAGGQDGSILAFKSK